MTGLPGFLQTAAPAPIQTQAAAVRAGSFALAARADPWAFSLLHDRETDLLLWMTRGQGRAVINGLRRGLSAHSAVFIPAGTLFAIELSMGAQALYLEASPDPAARMPAEPVHLRVPNGQMQAELTAEIDAIAREAAQPHPRQAQAIAARLSLVSVWLHRRIAEGAADAPRDSAQTRLVRRFARSVVRQYRAPMTLADHAEALDVTATHLTRVCRAACGRSASDILTERRLHAARTALRAPNPSIKTIADALGFTSAAYFSRFIQAHTGLSPRALRAAQARRSGA